MSPNPGRGGAVMRCLLAGLLAVLLGWGAAALALAVGGPPASTAPASSWDPLSRVARLNVAWTAALGAPLEIRPLAEGAAGVVTCSGRARLALAPLVLLASLGLLAGGALLSRWEGCSDPRGALLTGSSVAVPAAILAGLMALFESPPLYVSLGLWGRLAEGVAVRPLEAAGAVLVCGLVAGATGGMLASAGRRTGQGERTAWDLVGRALWAGSWLVVLSVPVGLASLGCLRTTPEVRQSVAVLEKVDLRELPRAGDLLALAVVFAAQSPVVSCGGRVEGDLVVAVVNGAGGEAVEGAQARARLSLCGGFQGEAPLALPSAVRAGVFLPVLVAVLVGWRTGPLGRRERVGFGLLCACALVGAGLWLSTWCDMVAAVPGVLPGGLRLWGWWRADLPSLAAGAALFGVVSALAVPRRSPPHGSSPG